MLPRDWRLRVEDILEAIGKIQRYTQGLDASAFAADELVIDAVLRNFTVIGEAARHIPVEVSERYPQVPWAKMRAMRNLVVHEYSGIDPRIVWDTIQEDLPLLARHLQRVRELES